MAWEMCTQNLKHACLWNKFSGKTRGHEHLHEKLVKGIRRRLVVKCPWNRRVGTFSRRTVFGSLGRTPEAGGSSGTFVATHFQARTYLPWKHTRKACFILIYSTNIMWIAGRSLLDSRLLLCCVSVCLSLCVCVSVLCVSVCMCVLSVCSVCAWCAHGVCVACGVWLVCGCVHESRNITWTKR